MKNKEKIPFSERVNELLSWTIRFITYDIWRITESEVSGLKVFYFNAIKTVILAVRGFINQELQTKASALTFSTLLSIVPMLAVIVGIAKGFGLQDTVRQEFFTYFPGHELELIKAFEYVERYLAEAQGGVIIGIGLLLLFYTVINLISSVEDTFNDIWQIQKSRPWHRKITDYLALFIVLPLLMTISSGSTIFMSTMQSTYLSEFVLLSPIVGVILNVAPYIINTKVKFVNGLVAGVIAGCAFQFFQFIYISGQIWVSKYNAIYGSFAALPLLLLWLQLSWLICLFGAELSYASQNVKKFSFDRDTKSISRRYNDFLTLLIASLIVKRFEKGEKPYTADEISEQYCIPIRITTQILYHLTELKIIIEVNYGEDDRVMYYQPALDIHKITVSYLLSKMDEFGSDTSGLVNREWETLLKTRNDMYQANDKILLKDL